MSETITSPISPDRVASPRNNKALFTVPAIGLAVSAANGIAALVVAVVIGSIMIGYEPSPHQPANAWSAAHATDVYLWSHPVLLAVWVALIMAAAGAAAYRKSLPAALPGRCSPSWRARPSEPASRGRPGFTPRTPWTRSPGGCGPTTRPSPTSSEFLNVVEARISAHADGIRDRAAAGDEAFGRLLRQGVPDALDQAISEWAGFPR